MTKKKNLEHNAKALKEAFDSHFKYSRVKDQYNGSSYDKYYSMALALRDRIIHRWMDTQTTYYKHNPKRVYYLSLEYLIGKLFESNIIALGMEKEVKKVCEELNYDYNELIEEGEDAGLGNGGLGRLASCFMDSLACLNYPAMGYGIRYEFGIFRQEIRNGFQEEEPDNWLKHGNPWEVCNPQHTVEVRFGGRLIQCHGSKSDEYEWVDYETVEAVPYDTPIVGHENHCVNILRLWSAAASQEFCLDEFNQGDYIAAVRHKNEAEQISKVLYPNDNNYEGKALRFKQQYFFVSASVQDMIRRYKNTHDSFDNFAEKVAIQLNDTHPALTVLELMRVLIDQEGLSWDKAWGITQKTCAYTNHTLMPEALEKWPVEFFETFLPRHLQIVYEINRLFLKEVALKFKGDQDKITAMSLIQEHPERAVRMAYLSIVGSHSINGVAALHSELLKKDLLSDFAQLYPERFNNKTNGITPRKWLYQCNPQLSELITKELGDEKWVTDLDRLQAISKKATDKKFQKQIKDIKMENKIALAKIIKEECNIDVDTNSIFDVHIKRIHEYKRQLLNILHVVMMYNRLKRNPDMDFHPMTVIFAGKAAPGYFMAKRIIKLINAVSSFINMDPDTSKKLKVVFIPNYRISLAERIIPATDLSEQISTAGTEASGTGNMKFALNGALTIGTMDGANIEMAEEIDEEHMFIFGMRSHEVEQLRLQGTYSPWDSYNQNPEIRDAIDLIASGFFSPEDPKLFEPIIDTLLRNGDHYLLLADLEDYDKARMEANRLYTDEKVWYEKTIYNIARMGKFSSDRTIHEYAKDIWGLKQVEVEVGIHSGEYV
jgi:starch phosphorylase